MCRKKNTYDQHITLGHLPISQSNSKRWLQVVVQKSFSPQDEHYLRKRNSSFDSSCMCVTHSEYHKIK